MLHLGYTRERALARGKRERDLRLLEACVADDPADFYSWFKMFELFRFWGEVGSAKHQARACLGELARSGPRTLDRAPYGGELITLAVAAFAGDDLRTAARLMDLWAPSLLPSAAFSLRRAEIAEQLGDQERARQGFSRCLGLRDVGGDPQLVLVRPLMGLARLALGAGDLGDAWRLTQEALAGNASDPEALLAASVISRARGAPLVGHEGRKTVVVRDDDTPVLRAVG